MLVPEEPIAYVADKYVAALTSSLACGDKPNNPMCSPDGSYALVPVYVDNVVRKISLLTNTLLAMIPITGTTPNPYALAITRNGTLAATANIGNDTLTLINLVTLATTNVALASGAAPAGVCFSVDGATVYTANSGTANVSSVDIATHAITPIATGGIPTAITELPSGRYLFATDYDGQLFKIDTTTNTSVAIPTVAGAGSQNIAATGDGKFLFIANSANTNVFRFVVATNTLIQIPTATTSQGLGISPDNTLVHAGNGDAFAHTINRIRTSDNSVTSIDLGVGNFASELCFTPDGLRTLVVNADHPGQLFFLNNLASPA
jgi:DNA-binding beta-propeller fold protein YncE